MKCQLGGALALTLVFPSAEPALSEGQKTWEVIWTNETHSRVTFAPGPILEIGSYHGLSTSILAQAVADSGPETCDRRIVSVELDPAAQAVARGHLERLGLAGNVTFVQQDAAAFCEQAAAAGERFAFAFIDHDHAYTSVLPVCRALPELTLPGAFCLFHDWLDARNFQPEEGDYGVFGATRDGLDPQEFSFYGVFGVAGLYRRELSGRRG